MKVDVLEAIEIATTNIKKWVNENLVIKIDKEEGKSLSTNDLTDELKSQYDAAYAHSQSDHTISKLTFSGDVSGEYDGTTDVEIAIDIPEFPGVASSETLGLVKVGSGLSIDESGTLSSTSEGGVADSIDWSNIQNKPTTLVGYGITEISNESIAATYATKDELTTYATKEELEAAIGSVLEASY